MLAFERRASPFRQVSTESGRQSDPSLSLRDFPRLLAGRQAVIFAAQQEAAGWIDVDGCCGIVPYPFIFSLSCEYIRALVFEKEQRFRRRLKMQWQF